MDFVVCKLMDGGEVVYWLVDDIESFVESIKGFYLKFVEFVW